MFKLSAKVILVSLLVIYISGCAKKDEPVDAKNKISSGTMNSDLVKKDSGGTKISLIIKPKKGDTLRYKMNAKTTSKEKSFRTGDKEITTVEDIYYYYSEEVYEIESAGIITYKIKFDSISFGSSVQSIDSSISMKYNSNIKDTIYSKRDFIEYNGLIGEDFYIRISPLGEITEINRMEKIYDNIYKLHKAIGDTLNEDDKEKIKESFGSTLIKPVLQQQFQKFPEKEIYIDSSWTFSNETQLLIFPVKNTMNYKLKEVKEGNHQFLLIIDADLAVDVLEKEIKDKQMSYKVEDIKTGGKGMVTFNLTRGCIYKKETSTNIYLNMKITAGSQSVKTLDNVTTELKVELLQ